MLAVNAHFSCFKGVTYVALTLCCKFRSFFALITTINITLSGITHILSASEDI